MDREKMKKVRWVQPRMIAEIAFNERTQSGHLRHSKFLRLRDPAEVHRKARTNRKDLALSRRASALGSTAAVFVDFDQIARPIAPANHGMM